MRKRVTSLSVGSLIREVLTENEDVQAITTRVFPVVTDTADLPYIFYRISAFEHDATKGREGADTVQVEICCCTETYAEGVDLAEAVRNALDYRAYSTDEGLEMRSCNLMSYEQQWSDDAHVGTLVFSVKV